MTEHYSDQLVLREAMNFSGPAQPLDPSAVITRARRRRSRHRAGAVVAAAAMTAAVGVGATAAIDGLRRPAEWTVPVADGPTKATPEVPAPVETVGTNEIADLGHGWTLTTRSNNTVCVRAPGESDGQCSVGVGEVTGRDFTNGDGVTMFSSTRRSLSLFAWLVPAETSSTVVTTEDGSHLAADVYALSEVPGARAAVVFVEGETRSWNPRLTSYDSTGAVVANWPGGRVDFPLVGRK